jgi:hypothetical protein
MDDVMLTGCEMEGLKRLGPANSHRAAASFRVRLRGRKGGGGRVAA